MLRVAWRSKVDLLQIIMMDRLFKKRPFRFEIDRQPHFSEAIICCILSTFNTILISTRVARYQQIETKEAKQHTTLASLFYISRTFSRYALSFRHVICLV
jgi:hypothetical protein